MKRELLLFMLISAISTIQLQRKQSTETVKLLINYLKVNWKYLAKQFAPTI